MAERSERGFGADHGRQIGYQCGMLNTIVHGTPTDLPPLLIAHGLFGSGRNWGVIAKRLSDERQVVAVDMRNHGYSKWTDSHSYPEMAEDLAAVIDRFGGKMDVLGHSMGGKAAMALALQSPEAVRALIVADIAPVNYKHTQAHHITAMRAVDLSTVNRRSDAQAQLGEAEVGPMLQSFFTQSLDVENKKWRINLDTLEREMPHILAFPEFDTIWQGPALFLTGSNSDYVTPEARPGIKALFPSARFAKIPAAGHWLHAEKPREFEATVRAFLNMS